MSRKEMPIKPLNIKLRVWLIMKHIGVFSTLNETFKTALLLTVEQRNLVEIYCHIGFAVLELENTKKSFFWKNEIKKT